MRKHKITVFNETAEILGVGQVGLSESGELLAGLNCHRDGCHARVPHIDCEAIVSGPLGAMTPQFLKRLLIVGAGAIGVEFASLYGTLGPR